MKPILLAVLMSSALIAGCSSVAIYETEKISITLESRGDASQPVSGNIGIKQRVAMIVPGENVYVQAVPNVDKAPGTTGQQKAGQEYAPANTGSSGSPGEAVSVVSYFNFDYDSGTSTPISDNQITIDTVLLTGKAAPSKSRAPEIFKTISTPVRDIRFNLTRLANAALMYEGLKNLKESGDAAAGKHIDALDELDAVLPKKYPFTLYFLQQGSTNDFKAHALVYTGGSIVEGTRFLKVTDYLGNLDRAIGALEQMINTENLKINGEAKIPESTFKDGLKAKKSELEKMRDEKRTELCENPVFQSASNYYIQMVKE